MTSQGDVIDDTCSEVCSIEISLEYALVSYKNLVFLKARSLYFFNIQLMFSMFSHWFKYNIIPANKKKTGVNI
jgi:hypothetical protein